MNTISNEDYWRAIISYGKNQSTYKLALGKTLANYARKNMEKIHMNDLANDFLSIYEHCIKLNNKPQLKTQGRQTRVEQEINKINVGNNREKSIDIIKENALKNMVLQKFHTVFNKQIPKPSHTISDDDSYLILQNNLLQVFADNDTHYLDNELSSR